LRNDSLQKHFTPETPLVLCGDFNVARDERDVASPAAWEGSVIFHPTSRAALEELLSWGLVDVLRQQHAEGGLYSWWDYRMLAFPKNDGLRLDYIFATGPLVVPARRLTARSGKAKSPRTTRRWRWFSRRLTPMASNIQVVQHQRIAGRGSAA